MSWKESDRVSERLEFVRLASMDGANISLLCKRFGVSRKTGYKWLKRWKSKGDFPSFSKVLTTSATKLATKFHKERDEVLSRWNPVARRSRW